MSNNTFITPSGVDLTSVIHQFQEEYMELFALMVTVAKANPDAEPFRKFRAVLNSQLCKAILGFTPDDRMEKWFIYAGQIIAMSAENLFNAVVTNNRVGAFKTNAEQTHSYLKQCHLAPITQVFERGLLTIPD